MKKITGLGGVFFKCDNPRAKNEWYARNLGLAISEYGATFEWLQADDPSKKGSTALVHLSSGYQIFQSIKQAIYG